MINGELPEWKGYVMPQVGVELLWQLKMQTLSIVLMIFACIWSFSVDICQSPWCSPERAESSLLFLLKNCKFSSLVECWATLSVVVLFGRMQTGTCKKWCGRLQKIKSFLCPLCHQYIEMSLLRLNISGASMTRVYSFLELHMAFSKKSLSSQKKES